MKNLPPQVLADSIVGTVFWRIPSYSVVTSIVILCTTHMMACSVVAGHVTAILCHSGAELFDNDFYSAFSR